MEERRVLSRGGTFTKNAFKTFLKPVKSDTIPPPREMSFAVLTPKMTDFSDTWQVHKLSSRRNCKMTSSVMVNQASDQKTPWVNAGILG